MTYRMRLLGRGPARLITALAGTALAAVGLVAVQTAPASASPLNSCQNPDNGDPHLKALSMSTTSVNVKKASRKVSFTAKATDTGGPGKASGVSSISLSLESPSFPYSSAYGDLTKSGKTWQGSVTINRWVGPGKWTLSVYLYDKAGNYESLSSEQLAAAGLPSFLNVKSTPDKTPPVISGFSFTPGAVNTTKASKTITFTAKATDSQSGISGFYVDASSANNKYGGFAYLTKVKSPANTYKGTMTIARWVGKSTWKISDLEVFDKAGNYLDLSYADLGTRHYKRMFKVTSGTDTSKPKLVSFSRTPATVNAKTKNASFQVTVTAKDTGSGVSSVSVDYLAPAGGFVASGYLTRSSGTAKKGVWKGTVTVIRCESAPGTWKPTVYITDGAYNQLSTALTAATAQEKVKATDHIAPTATTSFSQPPAGPVKISFDENVNGISSTSVTVNAGNSYDPGALVPGTLKCTDKSGASANCATGKVRNVSFKPTTAMNTFSDYFVTINPEHSLAVTDAAGNAPRREYLDFSTS